MSFLLCCFNLQALPLISPDPRGYQLPRFRFQMRSLKAKLVVIVLAGIVSAVTLTALLTGWRAADRRFHGLAEELHGVAATLAIAVAPAQARGAHREVQKILGAIGRMPRVKFARVLSTDGRLIAEFGNGVVLNRDAALVSKDDNPSLLRLLTLRTYPVSARVIHGGVKVGEVSLIADVSELGSVLMESLGFAFFWGVVAAVVGLLMALRLEKTLTGPILDLTAAMGVVREKHDYSHHVPRTSEDETGDLVDAFNDMLFEIRTRDAALARHRETLEQTVEERTRDLRAATVEAQQANAAKSDFLATMSHEIRTPMNGMLVMAELLTASGLSPRLQRYADVIVSSGKSLLSIINDILDFSKIEAGRLDLESIPVEPRKIVDDVTRLFAERAVSKGLDIAGFVDPQVPETFSADPVRLNQILSNLVNNALKFTEQGGVSIRVGLAGDGAEGADGRVALRFDVRDTGIGIPADKLPNIFEAFSQADQSTTRKFGGTGIGLTICRKLAGAMGGRIDVASTFGEGSTFSLVADFEVLEQPRTLVERSDCELRPPRRVLMSLEPGQTQDVIIETLRGVGIEVVCKGATSAAEAATAPVDLIIADGGRSLGDLRKAFEGISIVAVTRNGHGDAGEPANSSADANLAWPVESGELRNLIRAIETGDLEILSEVEAGSVASSLTSFKGVRVLAADDSAINREVLGEALARMGIEVCNVEDGLEAVEAVQTETFDLIFMDGSMPHMDGFEAARRIRAWESENGRDATPIVALTAHVVGAQANLWREAGMDDCVTKPFTIHDLEQSLLGLLPGRVVEGVAVEVGSGQPVEPEVETVAAEVAHPQNLDEVEGGSKELLDPAVLDSIREMQTGDIDLAQRVIGLYREHAPKTFDGLKELWNAAEDIEIAKAAHALKSLSRNIGAIKVGELCDMIENGARGGKLDRDSDQLEELSAVLVATLEALPKPSDDAAGAQALKAAS